MLRPRTALAVVPLVALLALSACTDTVDGTGSTVAAGPGATAAPSASGSAPAGGTGPSVAPARFTDCSASIDVNALNLPAGRATHLGFDCATVAVPLDYAQPKGRTISLQLIKVHDDRNTDPIGSLLVNPGGPGGSGVDLAVGLSGQLSDTVLSHFDVVGFDPRGVRGSTPVRCLSDAQKDELNAASPDVLTTAGFEQARALAKRVATACTARYGTALAQFDTEQTARDMDLIRQAVGDDRMNYLGFSYGTELGAQYAHLFPGRLRVMVLDGAVDPLTDDVTSFADQLKGFEGSFDQFAAYCRKTRPCASIGDPRRAVYRLAAQATKAPIPSSRVGETRRATSALLYTGVLSALYSSSLWPTLGDALRTGLAGDATGILALADRYNERTNGKYTNISDANTTIGCNDSVPGPSDATIRATAVSWKKRFPIFGSWSAPSLFTCQQWQPERSPLPLPTARTASTTVLVVGNLKDPATPYQGAKDLTRTLGKAELLTWDGEGHTSYLQGSSCVDDHVDTYLVAGTLPPTGTTCPR